jgi:hypothetical protein
VWSWQIKIKHAEETLQLFNILGGWAKFNFGGVSGRGGLPLLLKSCGQEFPKKALQRHIFQD